MSSGDERFHTPRAAARAGGYCSSGDERGPSSGTDRSDEWSMPQGGAGAESYSARSYASGDDVIATHASADRSYASADEYYGGGYNYASADEYKQGSASARSYASADESLRHTDNSARSYASADEYRHDGGSARSYTSGDENSNHRSQQAGAAGSYTSDHDYQSGGGYHSGGGGGYQSGGGGYNSGGGGSGYSSANEYVAYDGGGSNNVLPFVPQQAGQAPAEAKATYSELDYKDQRVDDQVVEDIFSLARHGKIAEVEDLLNRAVPVNVRDRHGNTILSVACQNGLKKMAKLALRRGADINARNYKGNTPLHFCYAYGYGDTLGAYLTSKGADTTLRNHFGASCYEGLGEGGEAKR